MALDRGHRSPGCVALAVVWVLARGLTSPLREMVAATEAMARGDFTARVTAISHDEIGTLAHAFNQMAAELAETDRLRRDLVANVSHELRTPITALQAVLENLVDGVGKADPRDAAHDARPRSSGSAGSCSSSSISRGSNRGRCRSTATRSTSDR